MPRIKRQGLTGNFKTYLSEAQEVGETNDCAVRAIAVATGADYKRVLELSYKFGRKARQGTFDNVSMKIIQALGFTVRRWGYIKRQDMIQSYPKAHRILSNITTYHPIRFKKAWEPYANKTLIFHTGNHMACYKDGQMHDFAAERAMRVIEIWEITKEN